MELTEDRKTIILNLISEFKKNENSLYKYDFNDIINNLREQEEIIDILKNQLELIHSPNKDMYRLTKKGIQFDSFTEIENEQESKRNNKEIERLTLQKLKFEQFPTRFWWLIIIITSMISGLITYLNNLIN